MYGHNCMRNAWRWRTPTVSSGTRPLLQDQFLLVFNQLRFRKICPSLSFISCHDIYFVYKFVSNCFLVQASGALKVSRHHVAPIQPQQGAFAPYHLAADRADRIIGILVLHLGQIRSQRKVIHSVLQCPFVLFAFCSSKWFWCFGFGHLIAKCPRSPQLWHVFLFVPVCLPEPFKESPFSAWNVAYWSSTVSMRSFVTRIASSRVWASWLCSNTCSCSFDEPSPEPCPARLTVAPVISRMCLTFWPFWPIKRPLSPKVGSGSSISKKILCVCRDGACPWCLPWPFAFSGQSRW